MPNRSHQPPRPSLVILQYPPSHISLPYPPPCNHHPKPKFLSVTITQTPNSFRQLAITQIPNVTTKPKLVYGAPILFLSILHSINTQDNSNRPQHQYTNIYLSTCICTPTLYIPGAEPAQLVHHRGRGAGVGAAVAGDEGPHPEARGRGGVRRQDAQGEPQPSR